MHKASFCLQAEKSVHLNNYVSSYPARNPECPHDRRRECRKETPAFLESETYLQTVSLTETIH